VFERDGYHAAAVSSIVQTAGLSQGAFYLYFGDKKAIFAALQEEMATLLRRRIYWATKEETDPARRLVAGLRAYFEFFEEYSEYNRRLLVEGLGIGPAFEARQRELHETLVGGFRPTMEELGVRAPSLASYALIGMASQLAYRRHFHPTAPQLDPESLAQACASLFLKGAKSLEPEGGANATS
jgi:AcrR family transcriptional regulator